MRIFISLIVFLCIVNVSKAQVYLQNIQGTLIKGKSFTDVIGSPFLNDEFVNGNVALTNGDEFDGVPLKYSSYDDELFFKNPKDGSLLGFVVPVKSFELLGQNYIRGLPAVDNFTENSYYVLIADSKVKLLFKNYKTIIENKLYGSANTEKKFEDNKVYYVFKEGKMLRFKPSKKGLLEIFSDKTTEIDSYLKKEKVDFKSNDELAKVFKYFSSL
ncbi:MAG: hypothetical protein LH615_05480 [Ferruginibacter sp.]|nr:hypothetical protein [Ferruginibacter sp.]